jgi:hypothetical protein
VLGVEEVPKKQPHHRVWCSIAVIPELGRLRQEDWEFQASLGYRGSYIGLKKRVLGGHGSTGRALSSNPRTAKKKK